MTLGIKIRYPKLFALLSTFIIAYLIFTNPSIEPLHRFVAGIGLIGAFVGGILFAYGFTAAPATALLIILAREHGIIQVGCLAGLGALVGDIAIFSLIRTSFRQEIDQLFHEPLVVKTGSFIPSTLKSYLLPIVAGFIIASPLPDEIGVTLLAASRTIRPVLFGIMAFTLNTTGIFMILLLAT